MANVMWMNNSSDTNASPTGDRSIWTGANVWITIKMNLAPKPDGCNWKMIGGVSMLAGIGFTVSLFIANLSFGSMGGHGHELLNDAKLGILVGSLLSGLLGYTYLSRVLPKSVEEDED